MRTALVEPFPGYSFPLCQHMGVVSAHTLHQLLLAAKLFWDADDPSTRINEYLTINKILTVNIRADSQQPDGWRDYQQVLSELGLIVSTQVARQITLTPLGLALLDGELSFEELMRHQVLRYQYPNGHKVTISASQRKLLQASALRDIERLDYLQQISGVLVRPAVVALRTLYHLAELGEEPKMSITEFQLFVMKCIRNEESHLATEEIMQARKQSSRLQLDKRTRRHAQEWVRFLALSGLVRKSASSIQLTQESLVRREEIERALDSLSEPPSFWLPSVLDANDRLSWYLFYGSPDLSTEGLSPISLGLDPRGFAGVAPIVDRDFSFQESEVTTSDETVRSEYARQQVLDRTASHQEMCRRIAYLAISRGARVREDPGSVDLMVHTSSQLLIIECKSITSSNYRSQLRYGLGQILEYKFRLESNGTKVSQCLVALAGEVSDSHWSQKFIVNGLDFGCITYLQGALVCRSQDSKAAALLSD